MRLHRRGRVSKFALALTFTRRFGARNQELGDRKRRQDAIVRKKNTRYRRPDRKRLYKNRERERRKPLTNERAILIVQEDLLARVAAKESDRLETTLAHPSELHIEHGSIDRRQVV